MSSGLSFTEKLAFFCEPCYTKFSTLKEIRKMKTRKCKNTKTECVASPYSHLCRFYIDLDDDSLKSENIDRREKYYA